MSPAAPAISPCAWSQPAAPARSATVLDINADMLAVGRERAPSAGSIDAIAFTEGNAEALPFPDRSFDAYTIAFGIRNVPRIEQALARSLSRAAAGRAFPLPGILLGRRARSRALYELYSFNVIPAIGRAVTGDAESYRYLVESIRKFPKPQPFAAMIRAAGFARVGYRTFPAASSRCIPAGGCSHAASIRVAP